MANQQQQQSFVVNNQPNVYRIQNGTLIQPLHSNPQLNGQKAQNSGALPTYQQATNPAQLQANGWQAFQMQRGLNYMPAPNPLNGQQTNQHLEGSRPNSVQSNNLNQSNGGRSESRLGTQQSSSNLSNGNQQFGVFPSQQHQYAQQYQAMRPMPAQFMHPQMQNFLQYQNPLQAMQAMQYVQLGSKNVNPAQALNSNNAVQQKVCTKCHTPADKLTRQMCKKVTTVSVLKNKQKKNDVRK
ncbi:hypothetical protein M3Y97_00690100 [Aphelenchoides bicaudatus]|nr:hypothetical protein M3Y97_00690100 [Aphelenchoides bicaudatus]